MMRRTSTAAVIAALVLAAVTSCSSDPSDSSDGSSAKAGSTNTRSTPTAPSPSPTPTGPCADGTCEITVEAGDVVNVPDTYGLGPIEVKTIADGTVEMTAPLTGSGYSISGCSGGGGVSSAGGGGVGLRCDEGTVATINDTMSLEVVKTSSKTAVLRIEPTG